jgi:hypothetical protein
MEVKLEAVRLEGMAQTRFQCRMYVKMVNDLPGAELLLDKLINYKPFKE